MRIDWTDFITGGGALLLLLAVICIGGSTYTLAHGGDQSSWRQTEGTVTRARIRPGSPGNQQRSRFLFAYEYEVDGEMYRSDRYSFASVGGEQSTGVEQFSVGDPVTVFYYPDDPSVAALARQRPGFFVYVVLLFGLAFLLASAGCLLAKDMTILFSSAGVKKLLRQPTRPEGRGPDYEQSNLEKTLAKLARQLREGLEAGHFDLARAAELIQLATEVDMPTARRLAEEIEAGRDVDLAAELKRKMC